jgi:peptidoglycan/LPS O-acetylase OafA/YrhL
MNTFKKKVLRRWIIRCAASVVALAIILLLGYAVGSLALQIPQPMQETFLYIAGAMFLLIAYVTGILIERIAVRSWDTWIGELGATETEVLREALALHRLRLEEQEDE